MIRAASLALLLATGALAREDRPHQAERLTQGNADRGRALARDLGCGTCHTIPGVTAARGRVGPPLGAFAQRVDLAGRLQNTPENLVLWLWAPQEVDPKTAMPAVVPDTAAARDLAAFLYTLR